MIRNGYSRDQGRTQLLRGFLTSYSYRIVDHNIFDWNSRLPGLRIKTHGGELGSPSHVEVAIRPKERTAMILSQIEREMLRQKDRDHQWDDQIDVGRFFFLI